MIVIAAYIEQQIADGKLFPEDGKHQFDIDRDRSQLNRLYREAVPSTFGGFQLIKAFGASNHLLQIAALHTSRDINGGILGIEVSRNIRVLQRDAINIKDDRSPNKWPTAKRYLRNVDIVTGGSLINDETWYEVKSWRSKTKTDRSPKANASPWKFLDSTTRGARGQRDDSGDDDETAGLAHKQFSLDRIARTRKKGQGAFTTDKERNAKGLDARDTTSPPDVTVNGLHWQFHKFVSGKKKDIVNPTVKELEKKFMIDPTNGGSTYTAQSVKIGRIIRLGGVQLLLAQLEQKGVEMAKQAAADIVQEELSELTDL